jgi:5-methyltetrahydrofolate--homocysteine methyltransferase
MELRLTRERPLVLDGAMGTELIARGLELRSDIAERWVLERPEVVQEIHRAYAEAGAQVIQTCTFGALRHRLVPHGLAERVAEICAQAIALARPTGLPVVASLGPTGRCTSVEAGHEAAIQRQIEDEVTEAARALSGADALHLETQLHPGELLAAARGARGGAPHLSLWISITVSIGDGGLVTPIGVPLDRMIRALREAAPDVVGVNCSLDGERMRPAIERLLEADLGPVIVRPQARRSEKCATGRSTETPARFATHAAELFRVGAAAVGGCCGTHPGSITALRDALAHTVQSDGRQVAS